MIIGFLHVKNFRCILDESIQCDPLTAMVGANGAGKSAFLRALELFYAPTMRISEEDYYNHNTDEDIEISITYIELDAEETSFFSRRIENNHLTLVRVISFNDGRVTDKYHGTTLQNPRFAEIRKIEQATALRQKYNELRSTDEFSGLPTVRSVAEARQAMTDWEERNPAASERIRDDGQFFGFQRVARGYLGKYTRFISIPAVRDASGDAIEGKGSSITELMDLVVRSAIAQREDIVAFQDGATTEYRELMDPSKLKELSTLEHELSTTLGSYVPNSRISIIWQDKGSINFSFPKAEVKLVEDGFASSVERTGHGLQRTFILTMLQHLAVVQSKVAEKNAVENIAGDGSGSDERPAARIPNLIIGIEEPELYQHPNRQRHVAKILLQLAMGAIPGVAKRTQFIYGTHSPLFVGIDRINQIRLLRKCPNVDGAPKITKCSQIKLDDIARILWEISGSSGEKFTAETLRARLHALMTPWMNEGFFADQIVLVEGESDRAAVIATASSLGHDFEGRGVAVIPCGGKNNLDRPFLIFSQLGIPVYVIWDSDQDGRAPNPQVNRRLLKLMGSSEEDYPSTVAAQYACFRDNLESTLQGEIGGKNFESILTSLQDKYGILKRKDVLKNAVVLTEFLNIAREGGYQSNTLEDIIVRIFS